MMWKKREVLIMVKKLRRRPLDRVYEKIERTLDLNIARQEAAAMASSSRAIGGSDFDERFAL